MPSIKTIKPIRNIKCQGKGQSKLRFLSQVFFHIKGSHTVYFSSSHYIINQKPMILRTRFHCITTWVARSSGWNSAMHLLILWFWFASQMGLLFSINFYFDSKTILCLIVPGRQEKIYFCTRKFLTTRYTRWYQWTGHIFSWL